MNGLLVIGAASVGIISLAALLASIGDWKTIRFTKSLPAISRRRAALTVMIYHTTIRETLTSIAALHLLSHPRLTIVVVDNATLGSHTHAFRAGLRQLYRQPIRLYARRTPASRRDAILSALSHVRPRELVAVIDGGDMITTDLLAQLPPSTELQRRHRALQWPRIAPLGPSFTETTETFAYSAQHLVARTCDAVTHRGSRSLPAGTVFADRRALRSAPTLQLLNTVLPTTASSIPRSLVGRALLLATTLLALALFGYVAYLAVSLQTMQPLLLFSLVSLFAVSVLTLWDQHTSITHKVQLLSVAPLSGLVIPVSVCILASRSVLRTVSGPTLRLWQLLARAGRKHP